MGKQVSGIEAPPYVVAADYAARPGGFALDGGSSDSWGVGRAWFGSHPGGQLTVRGIDAARADPFIQLAEFAARQFEAGRAAVVVALGYDLGRYVERIRSARVIPAAQPLLFAAAYDAVLEHDYNNGEWHVIGNPAMLTGITSPAFQEPGWLRSEALAKGRPQPAAAENISSGTFTGANRRVQSNWAKAEYVAGVERALRYIAAGDIYQVNLAQQFTARWRGSAGRLFGWWRHHNPAPFAAYLDCGELMLVSNSPECFLTLEGRRATTMPIKGTRRRAPDPDEDRRLASELSSNPKERAEHVMIVDLERNDLGRVSVIGSVRVTELAQVHSFPAVHHMVSSIEGTLRADVGLAELLRATFPGGSISGAPKIRAMEIIDELEPLARGFYTGALGILWPNGDLKLALTIRTATIESNTITYPSGGGIVADSTAEAEYQESLLKARPFLDAYEALA